MQGRTKSNIETWRWWWSDSKLPDISSSHSKRRRLGWVAMFLHSASPAIHMCVGPTHNVHAHTYREVFIFHLFLTRRRAGGPPTMWHTSIHCCAQSSSVSVVEVLAAFYWHSRPDVGSESSRKWFLAFFLTHVERFFVVFAVLDNTVSACRCAKAKHSQSFTLSCYTCGKTAGGRTL